MNATVSVICNKSRPQKNGEYPLTLRITKNGQRKYQYLGISVELKHWDFQKNRPKPNCPNKELINKIILEKEKEYQEKILEFNSEQNGGISGGKQAKEVTTKNCKRVLRTTHQGI